MKTSQRLELQWDTRWLGLLSAFIFLIGLLSEVAHAGDTIITFDDVPTDTFLDTQFHDRGVDFGLPPYGSLPATSQIPVVSCCIPITRAAPAGHASQVASISDAHAEFYIAAMFGSFTTYRQRVQVTVGNTVAADTSSVTLSAFDINGTLVGQPATSMVSGAGAPVMLSVAGSGSTPTIAYFLVQSGDYNKGLWVDDLTYDNPVAPAPPDFAFDVQGTVWPGSALHITQGGSLTKALPLRRFNGSNGEIILSANELPPGITASFGPNPVPGTAALTNITLTAAPNAPPGSNAPFTVVGTPSGRTVGPAPRTAQLLLTVDSPAIITTDGAGTTFDLGPCMSLKLDPIYVLKDPSVVKTDLTLALRVFVSPTETADPPAGLHVSFDPPVSAQRFNFTLHSLTISYDAGTLGSPITLVVQGTSGSIMSLSQPFTIHPVAGEIASVTPLSGRIPNRLLAQPGTKVTVTGQGFCPGAKVRFGNVFAEADPDEATPTRITVSVPFLASDGPDSISTITLIQPNGAQIGSAPPQRFAVDSIRNTAGFSFHNYIPHTTFDQLTAAFGSDQTEDQIPLCWPFDCEISIHDPGAILLLNFLKSFTDVQGSGGACFGIALAAQRFIAGQKPRSDFPPSTASNNFELDAPGGPSPSLTEYINSQNTVQISSEYTKDYLNQSYFNSFGDTSDVLRQIHSMIHDALSAGETPMIALRYGDVFHLKGHIVTAFDIQDVSADPIEYNINVYDPDLQFIQDENAESGQSHLLNVTKSQIHVAADGTWTLLSKLPSTEASGFINELIVTRASTIPTNPTLLGSLLPSGGGLTIFGTANETPQTNAPASRVTQLADNAGHTLFTTDGRLNNNRTTRLFAAPFAAFGETPGRGEAFLVAPQSGPIVQTVVGTREGADVHLATGRGLIARIETQAKLGSVDRIGFDPTGTAVSFLTKASNKPLKLGLMNHGSFGVQSAQIETTSSQGASDELGFDEKRVNVILRHSGPAAPLRVRLSTLAPKGGPSEFDSGPLQIAAGATATFAPANWTQLSTVTMTTRDSNGSEHQDVLRNHLVDKPIGHIVKLDIDRLPHHRRSRALDVFSRFDKVPPDSQVIIIWIVRENGQIVAHEKRAFAANELHHGVRRDRYIFSAPVDDDYEVRTHLIVRSDEGVISAMHASTKSARFRVGSVKH